MIVAWRIAQHSYWPTAFEGVGSAKGGGRWNSMGVPVTYLSDTPALAQLEMLANVPRARLAIMELGIARVEFDERLVTHMSEGDLPRDWRQFPWVTSTQKLGDEWFMAKSSSVLRVSCSVSPIDFNYILNPLHADFHKIIIAPFHPFSFDLRLVR